MWEPGFFETLDLTLMGMPSSCLTPCDLTAIDKNGELRVFREIRPGFLLHDWMVTGVLFNEQAFGKASYPKVP